jgi:hypothetical protein
VKRTAATDGQAFYAWIYADVALKHAGDDFLKETRVSWPQLRDSLSDLVTRYPDELNRSMFAAFACRARDREATAKMLASIPAGYPLERVWPAAGVSTAACQRFALERS